MARVADPKPPKKPAGRPKESAETVELRPIKIGFVPAELVGITQLVTHSFGEEAIQKMLDKQEGKVVKRTPKIPFKDFCGSIYFMPGVKLPKKTLSAWQFWKAGKDFKADATFGFPAIAFKKAMVEAAPAVGLSKAFVRGSIQVIGGETGLVSIKCSRVMMRRDIVRVGPYNKRVPDIRFRAALFDWSVALDIKFDAGRVTSHHIMNLFLQAGFSVGIGEHRPEKGGSWGMFELKKGTHHSKKSGRAASAVDMAKDLIKETQED